MDIPEIENESDVRLRIFISYSRKDAKFVAMLAATLVDNSYIVDFDQSTQLVTTGISPSDHWWLRVKDMIASADVIIVVLSPDSTQSSVVEDEIAYASGLAKRIIAVTCREVDFHTVPPRVAALNVNHWFVQTDFAAAVTALTDALERDVAWLRTAAKLTADAKQWQDQDCPADLLLIGQEIITAELWSARRPTSIAAVSELVLAYITASRTAHHEQVDQKANQLRKTRRLQFAASIAIACVFIATTIGAYFVFDGSRTLNKSRATVIARAARQAYDGHDYVRALRLSLLASRDTIFSPAAPEAADLMLASAQASRLLAGISRHKGEVSDLATAEQGKKLLSWSEVDQTLRLWDASSGAQLQLLDLSLLNLGTVDFVRFSPTGANFVVLGESGWQIFEIRNGTFSSIAPEENAPDPKCVVFSEDGKRLAISSDGHLTLWDTGSLEKPFRIADGLDPYGISFQAAGTKLVVWEASGKFRQWNLVPRPMEGVSFTDDNSPNSGAKGFSLSRGGDKAIVWGSGKVTAIDLAKGVLLFPPFEPDGLTTEATFSPDASQLLVPTVGSTQPSPQPAYLLDAVGGLPVGQPMLNAGWLSDARFSINATRILTLSGDTVSVWNNETTLEPPRLRQAGRIGGTRFLHNDRAILTWGDDGIARIWDSETYAGNGSGTKRVRVMLAQMVHGSPITTAILFADDHKLATAGEDGTIKIWSLDHFPLDTIDNYFGVVDDFDKRPMFVSTDADNLLEWKPDAAKRLWDDLDDVPSDDQLERVHFLCDSKLRNTESERNNVRLVDEGDVELVPLLQGRVTENVCDWSPSWYEKLAGVVIDWLLPPKQQLSVCQSRAEQHFDADPVTGDVERLRWPVMGDFSFSEAGIDIAAPADTWTRAAENGVVIYAGNKVAGLGNAILIRHASGLVTIYAYLREITAQRGTKVKQGDRIARGLSSPSGQSRLHFAVSIDAKLVDPTMYLAGMPLVCPHVGHP
ncbi:peptidoglycan DD-metalloendopeptidase family protein [Rhizobium leguminosarum]|uniref:peptidoglycan DD-metalloendopeptidase family protein n=1 Tax=Rhizobium leguminosarum TaxID=384 RepID=UPI001C92A501|nr:peptidoglycan DD-metalloendopeptidase family protein [Rhizobium leguminosarum]MBY2937183.1 peptidoglycan DD-metalloendopeptidase family protein [Rhizobium leguminosarum]